MYRRPKFLEILLEIRQEMAKEADYDVDLFAENARSGQAAKVASPDEAEAVTVARDEELAPK